MVWSMQFCFGHPCGQLDLVHGDDTQRALLQFPLFVLLTLCLVSSPIRSIKLFPVSCPFLTAKARQWETVAGCRGRKREWKATWFIPLMSGFCLVLVVAVSICGPDSCQVPHPPSNTFFCSLLLLPVLVTSSSLLAAFTLSTCPC